MRKNKLKIQINKPFSEVFAFITNPKNTPLWVDSISFEETNEWPVKKGAIYKNQNQAGEWSEYEVTSFEENKSFIFSLRGSPYYVQYTFTQLTPNSTELEYFEWVDEGEIENPFTMEILRKLKTLLEQS